ncbi:MAG: hypothetical protein HW402_1598 [Dehalococcoidales bacterium]|nr:hypothetical protein [Dehalococcoidales bacterium]
MGILKVRQSVIALGLVIILSLAGSKPDPTGNYELRSLPFTRRDLTRCSGATRITVICYGPYWIILS